MRVTSGSSSVSSTIGLAPAAPACANSTSSCPRERAWASAWSACSNSVSNEAPGAVDPARPAATGAPMRQLQPIEQVGQPRRQARRRLFRAGTASTRRRRSRRRDRGGGAARRATAPPTPTRSGARTRTSAPQVRIARSRDALAEDVARQPRPIRRPRRRPATARPARRVAAGCGAGRRAAAAGGAGTRSHSFCTRSTSSRGSTDFDT